MPEPKPGRLDTIFSDIEAVLQRYLPARDSRWWQWSFWGGVIVFVVNHPQYLPPGLVIPPAWSTWLIDISAVMMAAGGKFGWSSAAAPEKKQNQPDAIAAATVERNIA